jgi:hypothetical protein
MISSTLNIQNFTSVLAGTLHFKSFFTSVFTMYSSCSELRLYLVCFPVIFTFKTSPVCFQYSSYSEFLLYACRYLHFKSSHLCFPVLFTFRASPLPCMFSSNLHVQNFTCMFPVLLILRTSPFCLPVLFTSGASPLCFPILFALRTSPLFADTLHGQNFTTLSIVRNCK